MDLGTPEKSQTDAIKVATFETKKWLEGCKADPEMTKENARSCLGMQDFPLVTPVTPTRERYLEFLEGKILLDGTVLSPEERLFVAVEDGDVELAGQLLRECPGVDINWRRKEGRYHSAAALPTACVSGDHQMVSLLLTHPGIDVNADTEFNFFGEKPPLSPVCAAGDTFSVSAISSRIPELRCPLTKP